jgi:hypothetical protein
LALADDLLSLVDSIRAIPGQLGLRPNRVYIVDANWDGAFAGEGTEVETETEITVGDEQPPKVRILSDEQLAMGELASGSIEIGPITPSYTGGGHSATTLLAQSVARGDTRLLRVVGRAGTAHYRVTRVTTDRAMHYMMRAEPVTLEAAGE